MSSERLLLSLKHYIGDAVMTEPLLAALETRFTDLDVMTSGNIDQILWTASHRRSFLKLPRVHSPWAVVQQARLLRTRAYDVAVLVNHSFRSAITVRLAGIPRRIGHPTEGRSRLLTDLVPYDDAQYEAECLLGLARPIGIDATSRRPKLEVSPEELAEGKRLADGATIGLQVGARYPEKQIPPEVSLAVAQELINRGYRLALLGGAEERADAERLCARLADNDPGRKSQVMLVGVTSLRGTLGVLSNLDVMIGSDTGLMHMAAGVGCACVTVFGPMPSSKWGHAFVPNQILDAPGGLMKRVTAESILTAVGEVFAHK